MALIYSIIQSEIKPIPRIYSKELSNIVKQILNKDPSKRPEIRQLLQTEYMMKVMGKFVSFSETGRTPLNVDPIPIK